MMKRTLSLLLALIMVVGLLPNTMVLAADSGNDIYIDESSSYDEFEDMDDVDVDETFDELSENPDPPEMLDFPEDEGDSDSSLWDDPESSPCDDPDSFLRDDSVASVDVPEFPEDDSVIDPPPEVVETPADDPEIPLDTPDLFVPDEPEISFEESGKTDRFPTGVESDFQTGDVVQGGSILGGIVTGEMPLSNAVTVNQNMEWVADRETGSGLDATQATSFNIAGDYTITIKPDATAAAAAVAAGEKKLHINLYQLRVEDGAKVHVRLDSAAFSAYPTITEVVLHAVDAGTNLIVVLNASLKLEGLPGCKLVLDGKLPDDTLLSGQYLVYIGNGEGAGDVVLNYVAFRNAKSSAIRIRGGLVNSLSVSNCSFEETLSTVQSSSFGGAAIQVYPYINTTPTYVKSLTVSNCSFEGNKAYRLGGAISLLGAFKQVQINDNSFKDCSITSTDSRGGAISLYGFINEAELLGNSFENCTAPNSFGGAIGVMMTAGKLTIGSSATRTSTFTDCSAKVGGAVYVGGGTLTQQYLLFLDNSYYNRINTLEISGCSFTNCSATARGGAIDLACQIATVTIGKTDSSNTFKNCDVGAGGSGGGICFSQSQLVEDYGWTAAQWAPADLGLTEEDYVGGTPYGEQYVDSSSRKYTAYQSVTVENTTFDGCDSSYGGGLYVQNNTSIESMTLKTLTVKNCTSTTLGGGIGLFSHATGHTISMTNLEVFNNTSGTIGGGVFVDAKNNTTVNVSGGSFYNNIAETYGGGLYIVAGTGSAVTVSDAKSYNNTCCRDGGGIYLSNASGTTQITNVELYGNVAGAKLDGDGNITEAGNSTYNGNGGGMYLTGTSGNNVTISNSIIGAKRTVTTVDGEEVETMESAPNKAYGWYDEVIITPAVGDEPAKTKLEYESGGKGGGIYVIGTTDQNDAPCLTVENTQLLYNEADYSGGALYYRQNGHLYLKNVTVSHNTAVRGGGICVYENQGNPDATEVVKQYGLYMESCTVSHNRAKANRNIAGYGGGIYINSTKARLDSVTVSYNKCAQLVDGKDVFRSATVGEQYGGGIAAITQSTLEINGGFIQYNQATDGGGLVIHDGSTVNLKALGDQLPYVTDNEAYEYGGGAYLVGAKTADTINTLNANKGRFQRNKAGVGAANGGDGAGGSGGGIFASTDAVINLRNTRVSGNEAYVGYVFTYNADGTKTFEYATNTDENPNYVEDGPPVYKEANGNGGGVCCVRATVDIVGARVYDNTAGRRGGGVYGDSISTINIYNIYLQDGSLWVQSEITGNVARDYAGGIGSVGNKDSGVVSYLNITGALVENNRTTRHGGGGIYISSLAICTIDGGTIVRNNYAERTGGGIYANIKATVNISDAQIVENSTGTHGGGVAISSNSQVVITGGKICNNTADNYGGGVYATGSDQYGGSAVTIEGGMIVNNTASHGGGVYAGGSSNTLDASTTVTIEGGQIGGLLEDGTDGGNTAGVWGGGVYAGAASTVTIKNGTIAKNRSDQYGGGVAAGDYSTIKVEGGSISSNTAGSGGGVYLRYYANIEVKDGRIENNTAQALWNEDETKVQFGSGGGIFATGYGSIVVTGGDITGNQAISEVYYTKDEDTSVHSKTYDNTKGFTTEKTYGGYGGGIYAQVRVKVEIKLSENGTSGKITKNNASQNGGGIYATGTYTDETSNKVTIIIEGGQIGGLLEDNTDGGNTAGGNGGGIYVTGSNTKKTESCASVTISGGTISHNKATGSGASGGGIATTAYAEVTLTGGTITNNSAYNGGGLYAVGYSSITVDGGQISSNTATHYGGGVYSSNAASVTLESGKIENNTAYYGGGIYANGTAEQSSTVTVNNGAICNNTALFGYGGGLFVIAGATLTVNNGMIYQNKATHTAVIDGVMVTEETGGYGGGIYATGYVSGGKDYGGGKVILEGGEIYSNEASKSGGGIYATGPSRYKNVAEAASVTINGGTLRNNTAAEEAGGIYANKCADVSISDGLIYENTAHNGGGLYAGTNAQVTLTGGEIYQNTAGNGGGIYASGYNSDGDDLPCTILINGGKISGNEANKTEVDGAWTDGSGGGICVASGANVTVSNGEITANTAMNGGGIYAGTSANVTITGGYIGAKLVDSTDEGGNPVKVVQEASNTAEENGGGIYATNGASATVSDGVIAYNEAKLGGGLYASTNSQVTITGGQIYSNSASEKGGGIYATNGVNSTNETIAPNVQISGGKLYSNTATNNGGGIYATYCADVTVSNGEIYLNSAMNGGGIYAENNSSIGITGGYIGAKLVDSIDEEGNPIVDEDGNSVKVVQKASNTATENGGGIYATSSASVTVSDGSIAFNTAVLGGGIYAGTQSKIEITGGQIHSNSASNNGGGIYATSTSETDKNLASKVTVSGGKLYSNTATGNGGGIYAIYYANVTVSNGEIYENSAKNGAGLYATNNAVIGITGGYIGAKLVDSTDGEGNPIVDEDGNSVKVPEKASNTATENGGGIYATSSASVTVSDGVIAYNEAVLGGGIYATNSSETDKNLASKVAVSGGKLYSNTATDNGGGIYAIYYANVTVSNGEIYENSAKNGAGLYATNNAVIGITGGYIGAKLVDSTDDGGNSVKVPQEASNTATENGGGIYATLGAGVTVSNGSVANNKAVLGGGIYAGTQSKIEITGGQIYSNSASNNGGGIYATSSSETDETIAPDVSISGGKLYSNTATNYGGGIYATWCADVTVSNGEIYLNTAKNGGGIYANTNADVTVTGGQIYSNSASEYGGGIATGPAAQVLIYGGKIGGEDVGNEATKYGGGIYAGSDSQVTLTPPEGTGETTGGEISYNTAARGGGVFITDTANVTINNGKIANNTCTEYGGGVYLETSSNLTVSGGEISYNTATIDGGGIFANYNAQVTMKPQEGSSSGIGGEISNNTARNGGGVYLNRYSMLAIANGKISNNTATNGGGGIYVNGYSADEGDHRCHINGGEISNNTAKNGGGIAVTSDANHHADIYVQNGEISDNTATSNGGGIYGTSTSKITIEGGRIAKNTATNRGGGISGYGSFQVTVVGGEISENKSNNGGGVALTEDAQILVQGGMISSNIAKVDGGGLYVITKSSATVEGGEISDNRATKNGGGIYVASTTGQASVTIKKITNDQGEVTVGTVKNNTADNGGGVYVLRGGTLTVNEGHIFNNTAVASKNVTLETGKGEVGALHGAGGGICVVGSAPIKQEDGTYITYYANFTLTGDRDPETGKMNVGIYGNTATFSGDEVFSNGLNTQMTVPLVSEMNLDGYDLDIVGWFEDYNTGDTSYTSGLNMKAEHDHSLSEYPVKRYRNSTATDREEIEGQYVTGRVNLANAYVAMALGIPNAADDTVVVDYGLSVDIDLFANDMLLNSASPETNSKLGLELPDDVADEKEILYSPLKDGDGNVIDIGFKRYLTDIQNSKVSILNCGTAEWKTSDNAEIGVLTYTMNSMELDTPETFYYVVPGEKFYYYGAVNVIPATSIYFEDNCGMVTYHTSSKNETLAEWEIVKEEGGTAAGSQAQDRPGMSSILEGLDADNIYGYDSNYVYSSNYSGGSAYKVTVNQHTAQDKIANNGLCDYLDNVTGKRCYRKVTHTYQNDGSGKCSVCLNTEDKHSNDIPAHECTDGNNYNEYCDVCSKWIGTHTTKARASFTFTGTGFDIVSLCTKDTGMLMVNVYRGEIKNFYADDLYDNYVMSYFVDTCYGYKKEGDKWVVDPDAKDTYYQVPVIKCDLTHVVWYAGDENNPPIIEDFGYDTYTVEIIVGNSYDATSPNYENAEFYLDAIRIYNPAGIGGSNNQAAQDAYKADGEGWPTYAELRTLFISQSKLQDGDTLPGIVFIDGEGNELTLKDYKAWGPNNEIYLKPGQSIAFTVDEQTYGQDVAGIHLGMRGLNGRGNVLVQAGTGNNDDVTVLEKALSTMDLYYDISNRDENGNIGVANKTVTISNPAQVDGVDNTTPIAISTLKVTHNSEPSYEQSGTGEINVFGLERMIHVNNQTVQVALELLTPEQLVDPIVTPKSPALSFNGMVCYNVFFTAEELGELTAADLGLAVFSAEDTEGTVETADEVHLGATEIDGLYMIATDGVHAKYLGDTKYFRAFAKKADGSFVYSKMVSYSAVDYAMNALAKSDDVKLKQLVVAMLNYGAEAQKFFGYKTDNLMNKDLTADDQALLAGFDASSLNAVGKVDASKVGVFASTGGFTKRSPAISFKGAFEINYFFTPANAVDGDMTLYFWNEDTYNSVTELTAENADKAVAMTLENGTYTAASDEIAAKYLDKTVYVAAVYESDGVTYCSGVLPYSIAAYCQKPPATVQDLATAAAIYGCTAKQYFGV